MVKYLFVIFYLCVVMFLNRGHQLAKGETCGDGRRWNVRYMNANKTKLPTNLFPLMRFRLISLYMGSPLSRIYDHVFPRFPRPDNSRPLFNWLNNQLYSRLHSFTCTCADPEGG